MTVDTALEVAKMIDVHDRPGQAEWLRAELRQEIDAALGISQQRAMDVSRTAARVLHKLKIRVRSDWVSHPARTARRNEPRSRHPVIRRPPQKNPWGWTN